MSINMKCSVCKAILSEISTSLICDKITCYETVVAQENLSKRIEEFKEFFKDKIPNEVNYEAYLTMCELENDYKQAAIVGEQPPKFSRRSWFTMNVIQAHHQWPSEFGTIQTEI
jgi:hypothetical protein